MRINYRLFKSWITALVRALGPTLSGLAGTRGTFPQPTPTDANAFFVAPNGSNANPGTIALPFLTVAFGVAALTAPRPTLVLIRNGFVGDMNFIVSTAVVVAASRQIQAAKGEAPVIFTSGGLGAIAFNTDCWVNGITFLMATSGLSGVGVGGTFRIENCSVICSSPTGVPLYFPSGNDFVLTVRSCYLKSPISCIVATYNSGHVFDSCALVCGPPNGIYIPSALLLQTNSLALLNQVVVLVRCLIASCQVVWADGDTVARAAPGHLVNFSACSLIDVNVSIVTMEVSLTTHNLRLALDYVWNGAARIGTTYAVALISVLPPGLTLPVGFVAFITNPISTENPVLLADYAGALAGDPAGCRLQVYGQATPDGDNRWQISSPLNGAAAPLALGPGRDDAAPWAETLSGPFLIWNDDHTYAYPPKNVKISEVLTNPTEASDILGNLHTRYDAARKRFELTWEDNYTNNNDSWRTGDIKRDLGTKQWYPKGVAGNIFATTDNVPIAVNATFAVTADPDIYIITPVAPTVDLTPDQWRGWWLIDDVSLNEYYITSNTETTLTIVDKLGVGSPTAGPFFPFRLPWMLVQTPPEGYALQQAVGFTAFRDGGALGALTAGETARFEYQGSTLVLIEVEDSEDDLGF